MTDISNASRLDAELSRDQPRVVDLSRLIADIVGVYGATPRMGDVRVESLVPVELQDVSLAEFIDRVGELDREWETRVTAARERGEVLRYRAHVTRDSIIVGLVAVNASDPLASLTGTDNQFAITTRRYPMVSSSSPAEPSASTMPPKKPGSVAR